MQIHKVSWNSDVLLAILGIACAIAAVWGAKSDPDPRRDQDDLEKLVKETLNTGGKK